MGAEPQARGSILLLAAEFLVVFCALPLAASIPSLGVPHLPALLAVAAGCALVLLRDGTFDRRRLWDAAGAAAAAPHVGRRIFVALIAVVGIVGMLYPDQLLDLPRERPASWAAFVAVYAGVWVFPQELVYRAYLLHRYRPIFGDGRLAIAASAIAFSFVHVVYLNWPALVLTVPAGALLAITYRRTGSLAACSLEHAAYGIFAFSLGLGRFFSASWPP
jgi:membrane protease YdiL (CAAX protease family)